VSVKILKKKQYLKHNHSISMKVLGTYISLCMSSNEVVHTSKGIPLSFGDSTFINFDKPQRFKINMECIVNAMVVKLLFLSFTNVITQCINPNLKSMIQIE